MTGPLGVGLLGAGPVTQAIHLPTLAALHGRLRVAAVADVDEPTAAAVADRCPGARACTVDELLADPVVDVVAVCSPDRIHAGQVVAAIEAGKRGVLVEKPLATTADEAQRIADAATAASVPVVVGAMHGYDPAWVTASEQWGDLLDAATLVRSTIYLPSNDEFTGLAAESLPVVGGPSARGPEGPPPGVAHLVRAGLLGLASHTVPHLRRFFAGSPEVVSARYVQPWGYQLVFTSGGRTGVLLALMPGEWGPQWRFEVLAPSGFLEVVYPPSYVAAGSAAATVTDAGGAARAWRGVVNGYRAEWLHLADVVDGGAVLSRSVREVAADLVFALALADGADALLGKEP